MASTYFTKLTLYGAAQIAAATAGAPINLVAMAIGDGGGSETTPNDEQIQLVNETYRATLNRLVVDAKAATKLIAELIIPESVGGWTMREVGIYDDKGKLFAVANTPPSYKPETSEGSAKTQVVRIVIKVSSTANITIFNDPSTVIATVEHVTDQFAARTVSAGTGLSGGGSLANDIELSVKYGDTAETAAAGNDPRLVNAILKSMLAQETGFANDVPMSQNAVTTFVDHQFGVLQLYVAYNFINNERVKQVTGTSESDLMSQKAISEALDARVLSSAIKQGTGTSTTDVMSQKSVSDQLIGVGKTWSNVTATRAWNTEYTNTKGRTLPIAVIVKDPNIGNLSAKLFIDSELHSEVYTSSSFIQTLCADIPAGSTYELKRIDNNDVIISWKEL